MAGLDELMRLFGGAGPVPPGTDALRDERLDTPQAIGEFLTANPNHPQAQQLLERMDQLMGAQGGPPVDPREAPASPLDQGNMRYNSVQMRQWLEQNEGHPRYGEVLDHLNDFYDRPTDMNVESEENFYGPDSPMFWNLQRSDNLPRRRAGPPLRELPAYVMPMPGEGGPPMRAPARRDIPEREAAVQQLMRMFVG